MAVTPWERMQLMERELAQIDPATIRKQRCLHNWVEVKTHLHTRWGKHRCTECNFTTTRPSLPEFGENNRLRYNSETEMFALWDRLKVLGNVGYRPDRRPMVLLIFPEGTGHNPSSVTVIGQVGNGYLIPATRVATMQEATLRLFGRMVNVS